MNFPTSLDSFTNPTTSDTMKSVPHWQQHANANDAIEALQRKLGVDESEDTESIDYRIRQLETTVDGSELSSTPTFESVTISGLTPGSVIFAGLNGLLSEDNSNFYWDNGALRIGDKTINIGTLSIRPPTNSTKGLILKGKSSPATAVDPSTLSPTLYLSVNDLVLNDNDPVSTWANSGSGADFTGSGSARPTYKANAGDPYVEFDGTDDFMSSVDALSSIISNDEFAVFAVFQAPSVGTNSAPIYTNDAIVRDSSAFWGIHLKSTPDVSIYNWDGSADTVTQAIDTSNFFIFDAYHEGGNLFGRLNDGVYSSVSAGNTSTLTGTMQIGRGAAVFSNIRLKALVVFNTALSEANRLGVSQWLADEFGLSGGGSTGQSVNLGEAYDKDDNARFALDKDANILAGDISAAASLEGFLRFQRPAASSEKYVHWVDENGNIAFTVEDDGSIRAGSAVAGLSTPSLYLGGFDVLQVTSGTTLTFNTAGWNNVYFKKKLGINDNNPFGEGSQLVVQTDAAGTKGITIKGSAAQSADMFQAKDSAGNVLFALDKNSLLNLRADQTTDTAPTDDTTLKKLTIQKLASPPVNAAYIAFTNSPGSDVFYLVLEEA